ncbi:MAG TPA: hypothetical protein VKY37_10590 [Brumimicrobium sp.]|nr:hypothetical protein [Brumimicrobium sp.]
MRHSLITFLVVFTVFIANAQKEPKPYTFMVGLSWNAIDDDGDPYRNLVRFTPRWNMLPAPTSASVDYYLKDGMSVEALININRYKGSNIVNGFNNQSGLVFNTDINFKYSFGSLMRQPYFDPFIFIGASYTMRPINSIKNMVSPNIGVGFNVMITEQIGIQLRTAAKIAVYPVVYAHESNYLHHHAGVIYKFGTQNNSNHFDKKRYMWTNKKYKFRKVKGM